MNKLRARQAKVVFDFSELLPLDGEDEVSYSWSKSVLEVRFRYVNAGHKDVTRRIRFLRALLVSQAVYPGGDFLFENLSRDSVSNRVEVFAQSEWASLMNMKMGSDSFRHYSVAFETMGIIFDVVAGDCVIGDEELC